MRREAGMEDGTQLAVTYFASLKPSVKTVAQVAISSHLGAKLPSSINQIQWVKKLMQGIAKYRFYSWLSMDTARNYLRL
ncbi:hypothetical protein G6F33_014308 [Rhizopus arrhizus]|nr:hypothetical protein G6F33_014308 [Rhizopus arrhizus]